MVQPEGVVSLAERLKSRREELGISQSQAARELDVARTAYRLWEMEAAKPAPDRWRLIASWLGVSVTTMLFAEDLMSDQEAALGEVIDFARPGRDWNTTRTSKSGSFFEQVRSLIDDGAESGDINTEQAAALRFVLEQVEEESETVESDPWTPAGSDAPSPRTQRPPDSPRGSRLRRRGHPPARVGNRSPSRHRARDQQRQTRAERSESNRRPHRQRRT